MLFAVLLKLMFIIPLAVCLGFFGVYATIHFGFYRHIKRNLEEKRKKILERWEKEYISLIDLLNDKTSEEILTVAKSSPRSRKLFIVLQCSFVIASLLSVVSSAVIEVIIKDYPTLSNELFYLMLGVTTVFIFTLSLVVVFSLFEYRYFRIIAQNLDESEQ